MLIDTGCYFWLSMSNLMSMEPSQLDRHHRHQPREHCCSFEIWTSCHWSKRGCTLTKHPTLPKHQQLKTKSKIWKCSMYAQLVQLVGALRHVLLQIYNCPSCEPKTLKVVKSHTGFWLFGYYCFDTWISGSIKEDVTLLTGQEKKCQPVKVGPGIYLLMCSTSWQGSTWVLKS